MARPYQGGRGGGRVGRDGGSGRGQDINREVGRGVLFVITVAIWDIYSGIALSYIVSHHNRGLLM